MKQTRGTSLKQTPGWRATEAFAECSQLDNFQPSQHIPDDSDRLSLSGATLEVEDPELTNPLTATPSRYLSASNGKACRCQSQ